MKINMNRLSAFAFLLLTAVLWQSCTDEAPVNQRTYEEVEGDPMKTRIYRLDNGLTVYLSVNKDKPRVQTSIAVKAGSKNDPAETTGLAHYLEHMLFKGNSKIASLDWETEKGLLQMISDFYEKHRSTEDEAEKIAIYAQIDSISLEASKYVASNEYDKLVASLGAEGTNAYTSNERTVYINNIPSSALEKWMDLESNRFSELTLRLFHTELEAVYEEFNRGQDNDYRKVYKALFELLFPTHQYGTQTTIGLGEHLKNPSMVKIHEYFDTYYVPNNMAICLAGDLDYDLTMDLIEKHFGNWQSKPVPEFQVAQETPLTAVSSAEVYGPNTERLSMGFRLPGANDEAADYLKLIDGLLSNGKAGLIDINLIQQQAVLEAYSNPLIMKDYSTLYLTATPKQGQSLDEAKDLVLAQLEKIKNGEFEDWLPEAVINNFELEETKYYDNNRYRTYAQVNAFILEKPWKDFIETNARLKKITKDQIMAFANENFNDNYVVVYKRTGVDTSIYKVPKPQITPIEINRDAASAYAEYFDSLPQMRLDPLFLDYENDIHRGSLNNGIAFSSIVNETNDLFSMDYILDMGKDNDLTMAMAIEYLPFLGTDKYNAEELAKEFFKLGVEFEVYTARDRIYVSLSGLESSFDQGLDLFEHLLANAQADEDALQKMIGNIMKERFDRKKEKYYIHRYAMMNYAKYGPANPFTNLLSAEAMTEVAGEDLIDKIKSLNQFPHEIFYYGSSPMNEVIAKLDAGHQVPESFMEYPEARKFPELETSENQVLFVDYDMVQTEVLMLSRSQPFNPTVLPYGSLFNEYFGAGLSSIVFQEIRESKALAYSAYSYYSNPRRKEESHYVQAYVGTQTNKLADAVDALLELMNEMPRAEKQFEDARIAALKKIETDRITKQSIFWNYMRAKKLGLDHDVRKDNYEAIGKMDINGLEQFFNENIKGQNYTFLVIGNKAEVDFDQLERLGRVTTLSLEEVFGY